MAFDEADLLPVSALQHLVFCERRCALVYVEGLWDENRFTATGGVFHEKSHEPDTESRGDVRIARGLMLHSLRLGLSGKADVVEFHRVPEGTGDGKHEGIKLAGVSGLWRPFPVEYKVGHLRHEEGYEVQLCAQALCLEEMLKTYVPQGALFYGKPRRRLDIEFTPALRSRTESMAAHLHELVRSGKTPPAHYEKKCEKCSLLNFCMPKTSHASHSAQRYLSQAISDAQANSGNTI